MIILSQRLWRHQQQENRASETRGPCVKIVIYCDELFLWSLVGYFGIRFQRCFATREINTKITLLWALKQFVTRVHTSFSMYLISSLMRYTSLPRSIINTIAGVEWWHRRNRTSVRPELIRFIWNIYVLFPKANVFVTCYIVCRV